MNQKNHKAHLLIVMIAILILSLRITGLKTGSGIAAPLSSPAAISQSSEYGSK